MLTVGETAAHCLRLIPVPGRANPPKPLSAPLEGHRRPHALDPALWHNAWQSGCILPCMACVCRTAASPAGRAWPVWMHEKLGHGSQMHAPSHSFRVSVCPTVTAPDQHGQRGAAGTGLIRCPSSFNGHEHRGLSGVCHARHPAAQRAAICYFFSLEPQLHRQYANVSRRCPSRHAQARGFGGATVLPGDRTRRHGALPRNPTKGEAVCR